MTDYNREAVFATQSFYGLEISRTVTSLDSVSFDMTLNSGARLGHYEIRSQIGSGGMGEVYLAFDLSLKRPVAIKVLHQKLTENKEYWHRFEREARAISALNHPNVLTIHEIGQESATPYIVTELIKGMTLRHYLRKSLKDILEAIDITIQVASALVSAHAAGIIHRDIKPENIMIREDGYVKVLDFGIAKLAEELQDRPRNSAGLESTQSTITLYTDPRSVVGTISYMSPEQLRGQQLDARTDIWSLGVVIFEMITAHSPFERSTESDKIAAVLEHDPPPLSAYVPNVTAELQRIVKKALSKNREARYQTAKDLLIDLRNLKHELEAEIKKGPPGKFRLNRVTPDMDSAKQPNVSTTEMLPAPQTSKYSHVFEVISRRKIAIPFALLCIALVFSISYITYNYFYNSKKQIAKRLRPDSRIVNLTNTGRSILGAISPDGKYVTSIMEDGERQALTVSSISTGSSATIMPAEKVKYRGLTFSNDSEYIYYVRYEDTDIGRLYQTTLFGGGTKKLIDNVDSPVAFSPDGSMLAFVRFNKAQGEYFLVSTLADGTKERNLATRRQGEKLSVNGLAWSPDGKKIVYSAGSWTGGYHMDLIEVDLIDGTEKPVASRQWFSIWQVAWPSEKSIIVNASAQPIEPLQIWSVSYPGGEVEKITNDLSDYVGISLTRDAKTIVTVQNTRSKTIWIGPVTDTSQDRQIVTEVGASYGIVWSPDNRIIFSSMSGSNLNISAINPDGSNKRLLTINAGDNYHPSITADGRYIVFASSRTGAFNIWRINASDGSQPKQLTNGGGDFNPYCSPDNKWVVYEHQSNGLPTLRKVPIEGGEPIQLTNKYASVPIISPDGRYIACRYYIADGVKGIAVLPMEGGRPVKLLEIPIINWQRIRWTADSRTLTYVDTRNNAYNIWSQALEGGPPRQITNLKGEQIFSYDWSPDFSQLACERGTEISDVVAINFR